MKGTFNVGDAVVTVSNDPLPPAIADYFPGRDYPDRDVWLAKRATPRKRRPGVVFYNGKKPLNMGINRRKRLLDATGEPHARQSLIRTRHAYYRSDADAQV